MKPFNPADWSSPPQKDIETITARIESLALDIAPTYPDWRDLGFALVDAFGESGRSYYHRLSRFYPKYTHTETDKQYTACLNSHGHGITIKTFFHLAKQAGVDIAILPYCQNGNMAISKKSYAPLKSLNPLKNLDNHINPKNHGSDNIAKLPNCQNGNMAILKNPPPKNLNNLNNLNEIPLPTIPECIFSALPDFLKQITAHANSPEDADLLLLGSLVVTSACMPNVSGIYGGVTVFPNLFLFVTAQASAGKGRLSLCRRLVEPIHRQLREYNKLEMEEYRRQQAQYAANKKNPDIEQPQEPPLRVLFVPANSSATAVFQILTHPPPFTSFPPILPNFQNGNLAIWGNGEMGNWHFSIPQTTPLNPL